MLTSNKQAIPLLTPQLIFREIATEIGLEEAIVLKQIEYWISKCGKHISNEAGLWIYNSINEWHKQFSYWSLSKLRRILSSLEKNGILISKKINAKKWNHTKWYSIDTVKYDLLTTEVAHKHGKGKRTNRFVQNEQINNITKNNYTNKSSYIKRSPVNTHEHLEEKAENNFNKSLSETLAPEFQEPIELSSYSETLVTKEEQVIAKEMVIIWNDEFKYSLRPIKAFSNKKIAKQLYNIWQNHFHGNMEEWRNYVLKVNSSKFLMGEKESKTGFKAVFQWLSKPEIVEAIQSGAYGVGDRELDKNNLTQNIEKQKEEIVRQTNIKIAEYVKNNVSEEKEKAEFNAYVLGKEFEKDGDIYRIAHLVTNNTWLSPQGLIHDFRHKGMHQTLYESYVMKKYLGKTNLEARAEIKRNIDKLSQKSMGIALFERLNLIKTKIETAVFTACENNLLGMMEEVC